MIILTDQISPISISCDNCTLDLVPCGTPHFYFVANECVKKLSQVNLEYEIPVAFGVLTEDAIEQAIESAGIQTGDKGKEAFKP